jgi:hypothetical protein
VNGEALSGSALWSRVADAGGVAVQPYQEVEMKRASLILRGAALACALCTASLPALAQSHGKQSSAPARWNTGDSTKQQRTAILKKEINAAYAQQQSECRRHAASQRTACLTSARQTYQQDMANVPKLLAGAPTGKVAERVVSTTPAPTPTMTTQSGATTASGSTGSAGTTGSGISSSSSRSGTPVDGGGIERNTATGMDSPQSLQPQHSGDEVQGPPPIVTPPAEQK